MSCIFSHLQGRSKSLRLYEDQEIFFATLQAINLGRGLVCRMTQSLDCNCKTIKRDSESNKIESRNIRSQQIKK